MTSQGDTELRKAWAVVDTQAAANTWTGQLAQPGMVSYGVPYKDVVNDNDSPDSEEEEEEEGDLDHEDDNVNVMTILYWALSVRMS